LESAWSGPEGSNTHKQVLTVLRILLPERILHLERILLLVGTEAEGGAAGSVE
jgi:hypothetical protein